VSNIGTETATNTSLTGVSSVLGVRVTPQQFTHNTILRRFSDSVDFLDVFELNTILAEEASVSNHNLFAEDVNQRKAAENFTENIIDLGIVLMKNFSFKSNKYEKLTTIKSLLPVKFIHALSFVISSSKMHAVGVESLPS